MIRRLAYLFLGLIIGGSVVMIIGAPSLYDAAQGSVTLSTFSKG